MLDPRAIPYDESAENALLGAFLIDQSVMETTGVLSEADFYFEQNRVLFSAIDTLAKQKRPIDMVTVTSLLESQGRLEEAGGYERLTAAALLPYVSHAKEYAQIVREKSRRRQLIALGLQLHDMAYDENYSIPEICGRTREDIDALALSGSAEHNRELGEIAYETLDWLEGMQADNLKRMHTGIGALDGLTGGLHKGELTVLGARPGVGKSALALHIAIRLAKNGWKVLFVSLEMSELQYGLRSLSWESEISSKKMRLSKVSMEEWVRISDAGENLRELPIFINDKANRTGEIIQACNDMKHSSGIDLCIVDYLQLVQADGKHGTREQEVSSVSRAMKQLSRQGIAVLALSQLNREAKDHDTPTMHDLRESGALEQDADNVWLMHQEKEQPSRTHRNITLKIAKQRQGETGAVRLAFKPNSMRYTGVASE